MISRNSRHLIFRPSGQRFRRGAEPYFPPLSKKRCNYNSNYNYIFHYDYNYDYNYNSVYDYNYDSSYLYCLYCR